MSKYRKKPVVIDAFQWTADIDQCEDPSWIIEAINDGTVVINNKGSDVYMDISTLEGTMHGQLGDYIIKGIKGEIYPCKPDIFEASYEKVEE